MPKTFRAFAPIALLACLFVEPAAAQDGNETFADATVLPPGTLSVDDSFEYIGFAPDLVLGVFDGDGFLTDTDDDNSFFGNGRAPGLQGVPVNPGGGIEFAVSGWPDFDFDGLDDETDEPHFETGAFTVEVLVFDSSGSFLTSRFFPTFEGPNDGFLDTGEVETFSDSDPEWDGGTYDVDVDNIDFFSEPNDVDFFRFTGLTPGAPFLVATQESEFGEQIFNLDTFLGLFDEQGDLIVSNDEIGSFSNLSGLRGVVPAGGEVVAAVTAFPDTDFAGEHSSTAEYTLNLAIGATLLPGDFDADLSAGQSDEQVWRTNYGQTGTFQAADANGDGVVNAADWTVWRDASAAQPAAIPEPATAWLFCFGMTTVAAPWTRG